MHMIVHALPGTYILYYTTALPYVLYYTRNCYCIGRAKVSYTLDSSELVTYVLCIGRVKVSYTPTVLSWLHMCCALGEQR